MSGGERVFVIGVGMTRFIRCETDVKQLAQTATRGALEDAGCEMYYPQVFVREDDPRDFDIMFDAYQG